MIDLGRLLPRFWGQNRPTFGPWDYALNTALDECGITSLDAHEAKIGPFTVWISNYPYSFGYNRDDSLNLLPRVATRMRLRRAIEQWQKAQYARQIRAMKVDAICDS